MTHSLSWRPQAEDLPSVIGTVFPSGHPGLTEFRKPLDEQLTDSLQRAHAGQGTPRYRLSLTEHLLSDIAALLERCSRYREQAMEAEIAAVRAELGFKLAEKLRSIDEGLASATSLVRYAQELSAGYAASAVEASNSRDQLAQAWAAWMQTLSISSASLEEVEHCKWPLLITRAEAFFDVERDLHLRFREEGNSHNFIERFRYLRTLLIDDLTEAYEKAVCVQGGLLQTHGITPDADRGLRLPSLKEPQFFLSFVLWARRVMRAIDDRRQHEVSYDLVLPLVRTGGGSVEGSVSGEVFSAAMRRQASGIVAFSVDRTIFRDQPAVRLQGLSVSFGVAKQKIPDWRHVRLWVELSPPLPGALSPAQNQRPSELADRDRLWVPFRNVGLHENGVTPMYNNDLTIFNATPTGQWRVKVFDHVVDFGDTPPPSRADVKQLFLHMRLVYTLGASNAHLPPDPPETIQAS